MTGLHRGLLAVAPWVAAATLLAGCGAGDDGAPVRFGLTVPHHDVADADRVGDLVGCRPVMVGAFVKLDSDFDEADLAELSAGGRVPLITLEPWSWRSRHGDADSPAYALRQLVEGRWDTELTRIADVLASAEGEVQLRFAHEMNADWYPWGAGVNGNVPDHYVWAWRHVHDLVAARAPDVSWVWAPVASWWPDATPMVAFWPGEEYVDVVGVTGYGREDLDALTAAETFDGWYDEVTVLSDRPLLLAEVGASGPGKRRWIASVAPFLQDHPDVVGLVWFNTSPETTGATGDYRIDTDPDDTSAFTALVRTLDPLCLDTARSTS